MLHACLYTICIVFCYTSWHFYAFSRTNLPTRRHSASSLFLLFLCFRKATQEIFSELDETKAKFPIFPEVSRSPKLRLRRNRGQAHHRVARPSPWPRYQVVWPPGPPSDVALPPIYFPRWENLKARSISTKHTASRRRRRCDIGRVQKLFPTPCRRGESPPEAFFITMHASGIMRE
jgi:hypothetical protein